MTVNAAWYSTADWAKPVITHPAVNTRRFGARATTTSPAGPMTLPTVMIRRGPRASSSIPTNTPAIADVTIADENVSVTSATGHPVSSAIAGEATINA